MIEYGEREIGEAMAHAIAEPYYIKLTYNVNEWIISYWPSPIEMRPKQ